MGSTDKESTPTENQFGEPTDEEPQDLEGMSEQTSDNVKEAADKIRDASRS